MPNIGQTELIVIIVVIVVVLLIIIGIVAMVSSSRRRSRRDELRSRYGPEYDRTVEARGGEKAAEEDLAEREQLRDRYDLRDLSESDRRDLRTRLARLQYRFVEDPTGSLYELARLASDALLARGYPMAENRDLALRLYGVDHPTHAPPVRTVVEGNYGRDGTDLRDLFMRVREALRESLNLHYGLDDGASNTPTAPQPSADESRALDRSQTTERSATSDRDPLTEPTPSTDRSEPAEVYRSPRSQTGQTTPADPASTESPQTSPRDDDAAPPPDRT